MTENNELQYPRYADIEKIISDHLKELGFCPKLKGFGYMVRAIEIVYLFPDAIHGIIKNVYTPIAREMGTTPSCVERNYRTLIKLRWMTQLSYNSKLLSHFKFNNGKNMPSSKELIYVVCTTLSNELSKAKRIPVSES